MSLVSEVVVEAVKRDKTVKTKDIRKSGFIPAVIYSKGKEAIEIQIEYQPFRKAFRKTGTSTILDITLDGKEYMTIVHDIQYHPVSEDFMHLDLYQVTEGELVETTIDIIVEGLAPAVKIRGAVLSIPTTSIVVKCLPRDLFHNITIDVSDLKDFGDTIKVSDLPEFSDEKIQIITDKDTVLAVTNVPKGGIKTDEETSTEE